MGLVHYFIGIQVHAHNYGLFLSQEKYTTNMLINTGMADCAPVFTPLPLQLDRVPGQTEPTYFRSLADFTNLKRVLHYLKGTYLYCVNLNANTDITLQSFNDSE
ncbi:uncharacterized mitochondrial protein AtMg00810-like [Raphanus sativus]|uniref:Uncharacterized mitochondrial protein AtMg00810-like n=1 Tax=Raphanus sativus TaxID=3726 RepID=A0A6J0KMX5_RAPSA|nr:uncharacterized mitochondrial protein AtMg00810-like [Raphanus sativus]XP_056848792.1 uncharacterized mitochondrial protein AtMg00810-like [Raphanus sativus]